jgi:transposase
MDARTVNNLPPAATHDGAVRCLMAIELSKKSWIIAVNTPLSDKISNYTVKDWTELRELIDKVRTRVGRELKRPVEVVSCYEAGYDGFWLHRLLEENGVRNYVIDPASLQVDRRARRVKTDNIDVTKLLRSLMAYLRGEPKVWSVVRIPTIAEEDDRRLPASAIASSMSVSSTSTVSRGLRCPGHLPLPASSVGPNETPAATTDG